MAGRVRFARVVVQADEPLCTIEAELQRRGAQVTRLRADGLLAGKAVDRPTIRLLGRLYDGLIVPHSSGLDTQDIEVVAGVPVVYEDQDASALDAQLGRLTR
jgi:hypothetical protein